MIAAMAGERFLRASEVKQKTGLPISSVYELINEGTFPRQVRLGPGRVAWRESEIIGWMIDRIAERDGKAAQQSNQSSIPAQDKRRFP
jgi:prophage regulatory protein